MTGKLPVVDGDGGSIDVYGFASTAEGALAIARRTFVDEISHVERCGPITTRNGRVYRHAWLALTVECVVSKAEKHAYGTS